MRTIARTFSSPDRPGRSHKSNDFQPSVGLTSPRSISACVQGSSDSCRETWKRRSIPECPAMLKADAERECIRRWRDLPKGLRSTQGQAASFARVLMDEIEFDTSGDRYAFITGWLQRDLLLRGGL